MAARHVLLALLLAVPLVAPPAAAQDGPLALRAAVAPAQVVFDAGADLVYRAIDESVRDGTPDQARARLRQVQSFAAALETHLQLSANASHRNATLEAAPHAVGLAAALAGVPDAVQLVAQSSERCARSPLSPEERRALVAARSTAEAVAEELRGRALDAPATLDTDALRGASVRLRTWSQTYAKVVDCLSSEERVQPPFLRATITPVKSWPGGRLMVAGVTNAGPEAVLDLGSLVAAQRLPVVDGRFRTTVLLPPDAPFGESLVRVEVGALAHEQTLLLAPAPSELRVSAPARLEPGQNLSIQLQLLSPLTAETDAAVVGFDGALQGHVTLVAGRATLETVVPETPGNLTFRFLFEGSAHVAPSQADLTVKVAFPASLAPAVEAAPAMSPTRVPLVAVVALALVALLVVVILAQRRARTSPVQAARSVKPDAEMPAAEDADGLSLVPLVALLARALRRRGLASPSTTAREMRPLLSPYGLDARELVDDFERVRYGGEPEKPATTGRWRLWLRDAWTRLREGGS